MTKKNKITPLAKWTSEEHELLKQTALSARTLEQAFIEVSKQTKRTKNAVSVYYGRRVKPKLTNVVKPTVISTSKIVGKIPTVKYHNGVTKDAMIILQKKDLIVAKVDDIVITIEL